MDYNTPYSRSCLSINCIGFFFWQSRPFIETKEWTIASTAETLQRYIATHIYLII